MWLYGALHKEIWYINTEFKKATSSPATTQQRDRSVNRATLSEERIIRLIEMKNKQALIKLAKECHVDCSGSKRDIVNRISKQVPDFNKIFTKLPGSSGGWLTFCCVHGVVYYFCCIRRSESPRHYNDGIISLRYVPNVFCIDMAQLISKIKIWSC